jgi:hypothetical protein
MNFFNGLVAGNRAAGRATPYGVGRLPTRYPGF